MKNTLDASPGFTLLEVLIAVVVLSIGVTAVYTMQMASITGNAAANRLTASTNTAAIIVEEIVNMPYDAANYDLDIDTDGDGAIDTDGDTFSDGAGSNNNQAGLDDITDPGAGTTSDYTRTITANGGNFTLDINVARDYPDNGMDTIRVIVRNNTGFGNRVSFSTIKSNI